MTMDQIVTLGTALGGGGTVAAFCGVVKHVYTVRARERMHEREMKVIGSALAKGKDIPALTVRRTTQEEQ